MTSFVAMLRAVNVAGTGKLPMAKLQAMGERCGFANARTSNASGNMLFDSDLVEAAVATRVAAEVDKFLGRPVPVVVRSAAELADAVPASPLGDDQPTRVMAHFIAGPPVDAMLEAARDVAGERIAPGPRLTHVSYGAGIGKTPLKLPAIARGTARNMNSVARMADLLA